MSKRVDNKARTAAAQLAIELGMPYYLVQVLLCSYYKF